MCSAVNVDPGISELFWVAQINEFKDKSVQLGYSYHVPDTRLPGRIVSMTKRPDIVRLLAFAVSP